MNTEYYMVHDEAARRWHCYSSYGGAKAMYDAISGHARIIHETDHGTITMQSK